MRSLIILVFITLCVLLTTSPSFAQEEEGDPHALIPSILLESALKGDIEGIRNALNAGESIDVVNDKGWSAARFAVALGDIRFLRAVIDAGIDLNNPDNEGVTPLMAAAEAVSIFLP